MKIGVKVEILALNRLKIFQLDFETREQQVNLGALCPNVERPVAAACLTLTARGVSMSHA